jgi:hypothetical protein
MSHSRPSPVRTYDIEVLLRPRHRNIQDVRRAGCPGSRAVLGSLWRAEHQDDRVGLAALDRMDRPDAVVRPLPRIDPKRGKQLALALQPTCQLLSNDPERGDDEQVGISDTRGFDLLE